MSKFNHCENCRHRDYASSCCTYFAYCERIAYLEGRIKRLGDGTRFIETPQRYMNEWYTEDYLKEIQMRETYARDTEGLK